ncbi:hypothetical protein niasHT_032137 [Heterodera trifolii]|uniref:Uncharacterized protein n=1 Tax=Heterodera trifolii TaxID=157864 RepID=A0ABD2HQK9_9BILA
MAILLKCVLLLSIMAIFCDCMNTPGKKGKSPNKAIQKKTDNEPGGVAGGGSEPIPIPKNEGKTKERGAANSPTGAEGTPKLSGKF